MTTESDAEVERQLKYILALQGRLCCYLMRDCNRQAGLFSKMHTAGSVPEHNEAAATGRQAGRRVSGEDEGDKEWQANSEAARLAQFQQEGEVRSPEQEAGGQEGRGTCGPSGSG